jgi:hypothetical protein
LEISPEIAESVLLLKERLFILKENLYNKLFVKLSVKLAIYLNTFIVDQLLTNQYFFIGSAQQFIADVNTIINLFKWFNVHTYLGQLEECCLLLQMSNEKLQSLKQNISNKEEILLNYNITKLTSNQIESLVKKITTPKLN